MSTATLTIGSYRIERLLARTDLSEVFEALSDAGLRVCVKRLLTQHAGPTSEVALSFRREAALLAEVMHPNVVRVLDSGEDQGLPYLCLEFVAGRSLADALVDGPIPLPVTIHVLQQVAQGLARVHERGLLHTDLKPANVLLQSSGEGMPTAKLADFGLAVEAAAQNSGIRGTPHYMAPEQTRLVNWPVTARSNLYALGVMAYELLAGTPPFTADDPAALMQAHVTEVPRRLIERRSGVPTVLEKIVFKLLEKNPAHRYRSAASLASDLGVVLTHVQRNDVCPEFALDAAADLSERIGQVFVGRQKELAELGEQMTRARSGRPAVAFVGGVAGVGKSALLREFRNLSLTMGARFAAGKCYEFSRGLPYFVFAEALGHLFRGLAQASATERAALEARVKSAVGELGSELVKVVPAAAPLFPEAGPSAYLGEGRDRQRVLDVLTRFLEAVCTPEHPLVLLLDDLQWADSGSLQLLQRIIEGTQQCSLLVLGAYRSEEVGPEHAFHKVLQDATKAGARNIALQPFDRTQTTLLVSESLRQPAASIPASLSALIHERTDGNPLFVTEVLKALLAAGAIDVPHGRLVVDQEKLENTRLPTSVVDIVLRRLETLDDEARRVLGVAACVGKGCSAALLAEVTGMAFPDAWAALQRVVEAKVMQPPAQGLYAFVHDRVQEACTHLVAGPDKAAVHLRIVEWLERDAEGADERVFELAEHSHLAGDATRIWRYNRAAGDAAQKRYANDQALTYFRRALEGVAAAPDEAAQLDVRSRMTEVLDLAGRYQESIAEYRTILGLTLPNAERARYLARMAYSMQKAGDYQESKKQLLEALHMLGQGMTEKPALGETTRARLAARMAGTITKLRGPATDFAERKLIVEILTRLFNIFSIVEATRLPYLTYQLMAVAERLGPSRELALAHGKLVVALPQLPRPLFDEAVRHGMRSVEISRSLGNHLDAGQAMVYTSAVLCWSARYREALPWLQGARDTLSSLGEMWDLANAHIFSYLAHRACGLIEEALTHAEALIQLGERTRAWGTISNGHQKVGEILLMRGEHPKGHAHLQRSLELAQQHNLKFDHFQALKILGAAKLREGAYEEARTQYQAALRILESPGTSFFRAYISDTYLGYAEAALRDKDHWAASGSGDGEEAKRIRRWLKDCLAKEKLLHGHLGYAYKVQGLLEWRAGRMEQARAAFDRALHVLREQDRPLDRAQVELDAAEVFADVDPAAATEMVRRARAALDEKHLVPLVQRCDALLRKLGHSQLLVAPAVDNRKLTALTELMAVSQMLMTTRELDVVLERIVDASVKLVGAERGFIFTREGQGDAPLGLRLGKTADGRRVPAHEAMFSRGVVNRVDETGVGVVVSDIEQDESLRERRSIMAANLRSILCVPLTAEGQRVGALYLDSQITRAIFKDDELEVLKSFAAQASVAMVNALQFRTIENLNRDLDAKVLERTRELESANIQLSSSMEELRNTTLRLAEARREALEKELDVARTIQMAMVPPATTLQLPPAEVHGTLEPASFCGGDFWTYVWDGRRLLLIIGDVTGHGVGSAMVASTAKSCIDTLRFQRDDMALEPLMAVVNDVIYEAAAGKMVMTAFAALVDPEKRELHYAVAGHNPQFLIKPNATGPATVTALHQISHQLGDQRGAAFPAKKVAYEPGDRLVLFTDGIVERPNLGGDEFSERRLRRLLSKFASRPPDEMSAAVITDVRAHAGEVPAPDDQTLVIASLRELTATGPTTT